MELVLTGGGGRREWGVTADGREFLLEVIKIFWTWAVVMAAQSCEYLLKTREMWLKFILKG